MSGESPLAGSRYSLLDGLPSVHREDGFVERWCSGLDEVLAPSVIAIDCLDAYLDPRTTAPPWLDWLAGWLACELEDGWSSARRRRMVNAAGEVVMWRGTTRGVRAAVAAYTGADPIVEETGAVITSRIPVGPVDVAEPVLTVRVHPAGEPVDAAALDRVLAHVKPAHVRHEVIVA